MDTVKKLLADPKVRLALRAILAGLTVIVAKWVNGNNDVRALFVAGVLAAAEIFTPLNAVVGYFKTEQVTPAPVQALPPLQPGTK